MINTLYLPELREMLVQENVHELREFSVALHPARTAEFMEGLTPAESWQVLRHADNGTRVSIFSYLRHEAQIEICRNEDRDLVAQLIADLPSDDRVDLIQELDDETQQDLMARIPAPERREIQRMSQYAERTAGAVMSTDVARLSEELTVREALDELSRQAEQFETIYYLYIVDAENHLRGVVSARQLVAAMRRPHTKLNELMETKLATVEVTESQEIAASRVAQLDLLAIPVVDHEHHMLGIITSDDVIDLVRDQATEDAQRLAGVEPLHDSYLRVPLWTLSWKRGVWLTILFFGGILTAVTLKRYEQQLSVWAWLIPFIPLVIASGGNSGSQAVALVLTGLTRGDIRQRDWKRVAAREILLGLILGVGFALGGAMVLSVFPPPRTTDWFILPVTLLLVVMVGTFVGAMLPLLFHRMGFDPAMMSNPFVTGIVDILGIIIYINVAFLLLT